MKASRQPKSFTVRVVYGPHFEERRRAAIRWLAERVRAQLAQQKTEKAG